jgi:feruloyl esterase
VTPDIPGVGGPQLFGEQLWRYWLHRDPFKDWRTVSEAQFLVETHNLTQQFTPWLSGDHTDFKPFENQGGKLITTFGKNDQIIIPDGFTHYVNRVIKANGGPAKTQKFYRFFHFPEALHCGGAGMSMEPLFATLVNWVENGVAPDHVVAQVNPTRTRKVCVYPNTAVYNGTGSTDDEANFHCQTRTEDPYFETASEHTAGPKKGNNDIGNLPD